MKEILPIKPLTIVRILTMLGGFLGALVLLHEQEFPLELSYGFPSLSNILIAFVGVFCFGNMIRHIRVLLKLTKRARE